MSKSFVRGGQVSLHSLRMLKQVFVTLIKLNLILILFITLALSGMKISFKEGRVMFIYLVATLYNDLGKEQHLIQLDDNSYMSAEQFVRKYKSKVNHTTNIAIQNLILAIKICAGVSFIIISIFLYRGRQLNRDEKLRGGNLISEKDLRKEIVKYNNKKRYKGYKLGGIPYPAQAETSHTLIAGTTGAGKTILISELISQIKARGDKALIFDKMGVYVERFYDKQSIILNPFDQRSHNWTVFREVATEANFDSIAAALIPFERGSADPFWTKAARVLFSEVCNSLFKKDIYSNTKLVELLLRKDLKEAAALIRGTSAQAIINEDSPKMALSVMAILATYLKCLKYLKDGGDIFSIKEWIKNEDDNRIVYLTSTGNLHSALIPLISAWLEVAINNTLSLEKRDKKIWCILDELPSLHTIPSLAQGLAESRQFGGCFVLSIQSISQLRERYGINGSQTISALCNNKVFLRAGDYDSANWYSQNIGTSEIEEYREGLSYGAHEMRDGVNLNKMRQNKQLVIPSELINLRDKEAYFCMAKGFNVAKVSFKYKDWPCVNKRMIEIPYKKPLVLKEELLKPQIITDGLHEDFDEEADNDEIDIIKKLYE